MTQMGSRQRIAEETSRHEIESRGSEEDSQDELAFLVASGSFAKTTRQR